MFPEFYKRYYIVYIFKQNKIQIVLFSVSWPC